MMPTEFIAIMAVVFAIAITTGVGLTLIRCWFIRRAFRRSIKELERKYAELTRRDIDEFLYERIVEVLLINHAVNPNDAK